MLTYLIYAPLNFVLSIICYLTNPLVLLWCDEAGELSGILKYWQTWDNSCNPSDIVDIAPSWLQYDWPRHYEEYVSTTAELAAVGRERCFCRVIDGHFTTGERIKRYLCRVLWLTRNCGYGFAFWLFGATCEAGAVRVIDQKDDDHGKKTYARDTTKNVLTAPFLYKNDRDIIPGVLRWCLFFGWKLDYNNTTRRERSMIAGRVAVRFGKR